MNSTSNPIEVEVAFALPEKQHLVTLRLPNTSTIAEAISASGIELLHPEVDFANCPVGIWGKLTTLTETLQSGDRIEIYRPLEADPRIARRQLAMEGQTMGKNQRN